MKLADNYFPETVKISDNDIFRHYHVQVDKAFRAPGDRHPIKEEFGVDGFQYQLSKEEQEFFEKLYIPSSLYGSAAGDVYLRDLLGESLINEQRIGKSEKLLLDFLRAENRLQIVKAPIGWGKTVLLKYFSFYLVPKSEKLSQMVYPVYMSLDDNFNYFNGADPIRVLEILYEDFLYPRLIKLTRNHTNINNEDLWQYLKNMDEFARLYETERDLLERYGAKSTDERYRDRLFDGRTEAKNNKKFHLCAARYMIDVLKKNPILIFDNVDPLDLPVNRVILQEAMRLWENYGFRIIVSMRERTYDALAAEPEGIFKTYPIKEPITLEKRDILEFMNRRVDAALGGVKTEEYTYVDQKNKRYTQSDAKEVIISMLRVLVNKEGADFLDYITYHNLRLLSDFVKVFLATGFIEHHSLNRAVIVDRVVNDPHYKVPFWVLLSSILTANYETHFSKHCPDPHILRSITNLYCNRKGSVNRYFIRFHILNYFDREKSLTINKLINQYEQLFDQPPQDLKDSIDHALHRLLECQLLVSPEFHKVTDGNISDFVKDLEITDTGEYYLKVLSSYFEYIIYMKDDVELPTSINILDCITIKDLEGRYEQVYLFLRFLYEQELRFLHGMNRKQRIHFLQFFSRKEDNHPFVIRTAVEKMIRFGKERELDPSKFIDLAGDIDSNVNNFIE